MQDNTFMTSYRVKNNKKTTNLTTHEQFMLSNQKNKIVSGGKSTFN